MPVGRQAGLGALFGRKGGLGDSGTKPGTELDGLQAAWLRCPWGQGLLPLATPTSAWPTQRRPGLFILPVGPGSLLYTAGAEDSLSSWSLGPPFPVRCEAGDIGTQERQEERVAGLLRDSGC